jgi:hypothetical protein
MEETFATESVSRCYNQDLLVVAVTPRGSGSEDMAVSLLHTNECVIVTYALYQSGQ